MENKCPVMVCKALEVVCLIVLVIDHAHAFNCGGTSKTLKKAADIDSTLLYEYLSHLECKTNTDCGTWQSYTARCLENTTCVGIRSNQPLALCRYSNISRNGSFQTEGLWLIISELERFEEYDADESRQAVSRCNETVDLLLGIPDSALTASSEWDYRRTAYNSRMTANGFWRPLNPPVGAWIIADLGQERVIEAIRTRTYIDAGVQRYNLSVSSDGAVFSPIRASHGGSIFVGNEEAPSTEVRPLLFPVRSRYVRLTVVEVLIKNKMRWGIDGCTP